MEREEILEALLRRVREAKSLEDIAEVFKDAFGLDDGCLKFAKNLAAILNGELPVYTRELAQYLESLDTKTAIDQVGQYFSAAFPAWRQTPHGNLPLLVLERMTGAEIGAKTQIVLLSPDTLRKQAEHHPELTQEDYEKAQDVIKRGQRFKQNERKLAFMIDEPNGRAVIIKVTKNGDELYATSIWRLSSKDERRIKAMRKLMKEKS